MATMVALGALVSSRVLARRGARLPMVAAGVALAAGGVLLSRLTASSGLAPLAVAFVVFGIGGGRGQRADHVHGGVRHAGLAGRAWPRVSPPPAGRSASVLGIAVTGSILAGNLRGQPLPDGFVAASHADWLLLAAMGVVVVVLGLVTASRWALGTAARTAAMFEGSHRDPSRERPGSLRLVPGDLPQVVQAGDRDVPLAGPDDAAPPPVAQGPRHRGPRRAGQAG